jgi:hypothetical protein
LSISTFLDVPFSMRTILNDGFRLNRRSSFSDDDPISRVYKSSPRFRSRSFFSRVYSTVPVGVLRKGVGSEGCDDLSHHGLIDFSLLFYEFF